MRLSAAHRGELDGLRDGPVANVRADADSSRPANAAQNQAQPQLPRVTTTVEVHGEVKETIFPRRNGGNAGWRCVEDAPLSATVVTRELLNDQVARVLSDVVKNDASVGDDYVPVGYYGVFEIRGFPIDLATGLADQRHDHCRRAGCAAGKQGAASNC